MAQNDEFIREVDEEYRRDQIAAIWKRYNGVIVGLAILVVAAVGGWRYWQHMQDTRSQAAAVRYQEALQLSAEPAKSDEAEKVLENLAKDAPEGYGLLDPLPPRGRTRWAIRKTARRRSTRSPPIWVELRSGTILPGCAPPCSSR